MATAASGSRVPTVRPDDIPRRSAGTGIVRGSSKRLLGLVGAGAALALLVLLSIAVGSKPIALGTVFDAFRHYDSSLDDHLIVRTMRLPRTEVGLLVGVALGLGGAVMQGLARNPLADPGILGVNAGAALLVVIGIYGFGVASLYGYVWFAFAGAGAASVAVYAIGSLGREGATPIKLSLAGVAITTLCASVTTAIVLLDAATLDSYRFWAVGALSGRDTAIAASVTPFILAGTLIALACGPTLNTLALGDDVAKGLGQRVGRARAVCALGVVLLCGAATAAAGPIGFVGLVVPHVARSITGPDYRWILPYSMVLAPILVLGSDIVGRLVLRPAELEVGIVTAAIGAPFFVWLVRRRNLAEL